MNDFLDFSGAVLALVVNIIIFPLIVVLDTLLALVVAVRYARELKKKMYRSLIRQRASLHQNLLKRQMSFYKKIAR